MFCLLDLAHLVDPLGVAGEGRETKVEIRLIASHYTFHSQVNVRPQRQVYPVRARTILLQYVAQANVTTAMIAFGRPGTATVGHSIPCRRGQR